MTHSISLPRPLTRGLGLLGALLAIGVALASYRYMFPALPVPDMVGSNANRFPWLLVHAASAATALLVAPWQFWSGLRARRPRLHRRLGQVYVAGCLIGGASGLLLALGASTGAVSTAGFGLLAIGWLWTTTQAWRLAVRRDFAAHRRWMIRSFALTFAAVTLRIYLPTAMALPFDFADSYRAISFLCWVPNVAVAEWWLRRR